MEEAPRPEAMPPDVISEKAETTTAESTAGNPAGGPDKHEEKELQASSKPTLPPSSKNTVYPALAATLSNTDIAMVRLNR